MTILVVANSTVENSVVPNGTDDRSTSQMSVVESGQTPPVTDFDVLVVGGGTAGSVIAARLCADPGRRVGVLEWGPSDVDEPRALQIARWPEMLEGEYDLDYRSVPQERGNSNIRQARATILGGCSSVNTMIAWKPLASDLREWVAAGARGWEPSVILPYWDRLAAPITPVAPEHRNPLVELGVRSAVSALGVPRRETWNDLPGDLVEGAGFFEIGYDPATGVRSSASVSYLHPVLGRENLHVLLRRRALRLEFEGTRAKAVVCEGGERFTAREIVLSCGAIDTPRLLLLSGVGPAGVLKEAGVDLVLDRPGVGENLQDHAEGLTVFEIDCDVPDVRATDWDAGVLARVDENADRPDVLMHLPVTTVGGQAEAQGAVLPPRNLSMASNVAKPRSRGRVWIDSGDPTRPPLIDYRYFTDPDGHDERMLVAGIRLARRIAAAEPLARHIVREVFPGPDAQTDEEISRIERAAHQTVYHVSGTCRMGRPDDPDAVVDPELRVIGLEGLRIADASVFPTVTAVNPVGTVLVLAERAADLIVG
ncbi:choline dehydrogenase-like flavoprotein [Kineosporia succinea]|uniref:Choline dehydrogenase-like flavoprotein n=2 Tax=Kineosporia succinea TaxID=84632 RepID=A0ABT9P8B7_9ACTN|nr:GMC oxidoreductase [Kineosporia succinea]MDP9828936.1 choline dehydrogenase-like flavoprotein [Kineosporia succinea]